MVVEILFLGEGVFGSSRFLKFPNFELQTERLDLLEPILSFRNLGYRKKDWIWLCERERERWSERERERELDFQNPTEVAEKTGPIRFN